MNNKYVWWRISSCALLFLEIWMKSKWRRNMNESKWRMRKSSNVLQQILEKKKINYSVSINIASLVFSFCINSINSRQNKSEIPFPNKQVVVRECVKILSITCVIGYKIFFIYLLHILSSLFRQIYFYRKEYKTRTVKVYNS